MAGDKGFCWIFFISAFFNFTFPMSQCSHMYGCVCRMLSSVIECELIVGVHAMGGCVHFKQFCVVLPFPSKVGAHTGNSSCHRIITKISRGSRSFLIVRKGLPDCRTLDSNCPPDLCGVVSARCGSVARVLQVVRFSLANRQVVDCSCGSVSVSVSGA